MEIKTLFGRRLRALRTLQGLSQDELARIAQMDRVFLGQLERGQRTASLESVEKLAGALRVAPKDLLEFAATPRPIKLTGEEKLGQRVSVLAQGAPPAELARFEKLAEVFFAEHRPRRQRG